MTGFNKVLLMGRLTRDPQLDTLPSGTVACQLGLAVNRRWKDAQGQEREEVLFADCTAFGKRGEALAAYFKKGNPIHIEGHLKLERWEAQDGTTRSKIRVMVERFCFVESGGAGAGKTTNKNAHANEPRKPAKRVASGHRPKPAPAEPILAATIPTDDIPF